MTIHSNIIFWWLYFWRGKEEGRRDQGGKEGNTYLYAWWRESTGNHLWPLLYFHLPYDVFSYHTNMDDTISVIQCVSKQKDLEHYQKYNFFWFVLPSLFLWIINISNWTYWVILNGLLGHSQTLVRGGGRTWYKKGVLRIF